MAIATNSGHVSRALDFYNKPGKYFSVGRTTPWDNETVPPAPSVSAYKIEELIALKKVDNVHLVVEDPENGSIVYKDSKWRIVQPEIVASVGSGGVSAGSYSVSISSLTSIVVGIKLRINSVYEGKVISVNTSTSTVTLDTAAPEFIPEGSTVLGGAYVEQAKYVYVSCTLSYNNFPTDISYRQVGLHTEVLPNNVDVLRSAEHSPTSSNEYTSLGNLEIIDNRSPVTRTEDQAEGISVIIEF